MVPPIHGYLKEMNRKCSKISANEVARAGNLRMPDLVDATMA